MTRQVLDFSRRWVWIVGAGLPLTAALVLGRGASSEPPDEPNVLTPGPQLVAVLIGSSTCVGTKPLDVRQALKRSLDDLRVFAERRGMHFVSVGISIDVRPETGIPYLRGLYAFDELAAGDNWMGVGPSQFIWQADSVVSTVPQLILISRDLVAQSRSGGNGIHFENQRTLVKYVGGAGLKSIDTSAVAAALRKTAKVAVDPARPHE